jgi:hypothetical protein
MSHLVVSWYRAKPGCEDRLTECLDRHLPLLTQYALVSDRTPIRTRLSEGTFVEVFEWVSEEALRQAHAVPEITDLWAQIAEYSEPMMMDEDMLDELRDAFDSFRTPGSAATDN